MRLHANAKLGPAGRRELALAIERGMTLTAGDALLTSRLVLSAVSSGENRDARLLSAGSTRRRAAATARWRLRVAISRRFWRGVVSGGGSMLAKGGSDGRRLSST
jgi:hypothetical protein